MNATLIIGLPILGIIILIVYKKIKKALKPSEKWKISQSIKLKDLFNKTNSSDVLKVESIKNDLIKVLDNVLIKKGISGNDLKSRVEGAKRLLNSALYTELLKSINCGEKQDLKSIKQDINTIYNSANSLITKR